MKPKCIFVTGGAIPTLGKGVFSASLAYLLKSSGHKVTVLKFDPVIASGAGECFVTEDGYEASATLGCVERIAGIRTSRANNVNLGRIFQMVLDKERRGDYQGTEVQMTPHVTDEIKHCVNQLEASADYDFVIVEIGGAVGDMASLPFIEAMRQLRKEMAGGAISIHIAHTPCQATEPVVQSVRQLQSLGVQPEILVLRSFDEVPHQMVEQIAEQCNLYSDDVIQYIDTPSPYQQPEMLHSQHIAELVCSKLQTILSDVADLQPWIEFADKLFDAKREVNIAVIGSYEESLHEALLAAATHAECKLELRYIDSSRIDARSVEELLSPFDGVVVAPKNGMRDIDGELIALSYCRCEDIPTIAINFGMHCMAIEFARNVLGLDEANSMEVSPSTPSPVVALMEQPKMIADGCIMRLGSYPCRLKPESIVAEAYGDAEEVTERHRHSYELNIGLRSRFEEAGMICSGENPSTHLVEAIELTDRHWYVGVQFNPEYSSTMLEPHPLLKSFIKAVEARATENEINN